MNTIRLTTAIVLATTTLISSNSFALEESKKGDLKGAAYFTGSAAVGALVGGPLGMVIGAVAGGLYDEQTNKKDLANKKLTRAEDDIAMLENQINEQTVAIVELENKVAKKLEFKVMFPTGVDTLSMEDEQRIESLSDYLKENTHLQVRLDGHADPRGTDEYNNVLSAERAKTVAAALEESGIEKTRINVFFHGSSKAVVEDNKQDSYAFARRVNIEVFAKDAQQNMASTN